MGGTGFLRAGEGMNDRRIKRRASGG